MFQEEILSAFLLRNAKAIKNQSFHSKIKSENHWIADVVKKYIESGFNSEISDPYIRKFRKTDTSFCDFLIGFKTSLDFENELRRKEKYARQWLIPRLDTKSKSNRIV